MTRILSVFLSVMLAFSSNANAGQSALTIAAASDLRYALDDIGKEFRQVHPEADLRIIYGSSGKMTTQIINGAPYDLFFSADIAFPERLKQEGLTATSPRVYALGRIVIWAPNGDEPPLTFEDLTSDEVRRVAIAQPRHAPYGMRAREALKTADLWEELEPKLVFGENIAQTAQMVNSGGADAGIIALSLALFPALEEHGYTLIDDELHEPLSQGFVITRHGADHPLSQRFVEFMESDEALRIMADYGFVRPEAPQ